MLLGTNSESKIELELVQKVRDYNIKTVFILEHWYNLRKRFYLNNKKVCPTEIWVYEKKTRRLARRSVVASKNISADELFSTKNLTCKRPGTGISPTNFFKIIGKKAKKNIKINKIISKNDFF